MYFSTCSNNCTNKYKTNKSGESQKYGAKKTRIANEYIGQKSIKQTPPLMSDDVQVGSNTRRGI